MVVEKREIESRKRVGTLKGQGVFEMVLKGGLCMIVACTKSNGFETLGMAPHTAIAKFIAKSKTNDEIQWTELSKSEDAPYEAIAQFVPKYTAITDAIRARQGLK